MFDLPYFDVLFTQLNAGNTEIEKVFGLNVHWGYWDEPLPRPPFRSEDFAVAARRMTRKVYQRALIASGQRVLDVGCGFGGTIYELNENFSNMDLVGLNIDPRQLERARKLIQPKNGNRITFVEGNAIDLPFSAAEFDAVLAVECIFHFPSRQKFFEESHRVLKNTGKLVVSDFVPYGPTLPLLILQLGPVFSASGAIYGKHNIAYTQLQYCYTSRVAGFKDMNTTDITRNTLPTYDYLELLASDYASDSRAKESFTKVNRFLAKATAKNQLRYKIFDFSRRE